MLEIINFSKTYQDSKKAVNCLNLNVNNGELFGFLGHNGAGKTTTIKSVVGILNFEEGEIILDGISIKKEPLKYKKKIAYIPDNPDIYESLTAIQYLNFVADIYKLDKETRIKNIEKYAKLFEIYDSLNNVISSFSHGMKQKVVLISAFIHEPDLIVLDEPFVGLDPIASFTLKKLMREYCDSGKIIFFSTHVLEVAEKICDRIGIINSGNLVKVGSIKDIVENRSLEEVFMEAR